MRRLGAVARLARLHAAGWEGLIFVLGPLMVGERLGHAAVVRLWVLGVLINSFIFILNNLADLPRDRLDPSRQFSPLVSGEVSTSLALWLSCLLPILMWLVIALSHWPRVAQTSFAGCLVLGSFLCVYQKTLLRPHPVVLDSLFGIAMAAPVPVGIASLGVRVPRQAWLLTGALAVLSLGLNAVGGNLKDLESDLRTGFRTVATSMGVQITDGGEIWMPRGYRRFIYAVAALSTLLFGLSAITIWADFKSPKASILALVVLALALAVPRDVHKLAAGRRAPAKRGREPFFALGMGAVLVAAASYAPVLDLAVAVFVALAWDRAFRSGHASLGSR